MYRFGPLEIVLVLVCGGGVAVAVLAAAYFVIRAATKAGMKDAQKKE